jgi:uncharacterized protein YfaP (DUF2135 family)
MLPYRDSRITVVAIVAFFVIALGYAYFEVSGLLYGPRISVSSATTEVHDPFIDITGQADRIASLAMNGKAINVTESGAFDEPYLLSPGLNRITLDAADKYGRHRTQVIQIVYTPSSAEATQDKPVATSTVATSTVDMASTTPAATSTVPMAPVQ